MNNNIQKTSYDVNIKYLFIYLFKNHPLLIFFIKKINIDEISTQTT